MGDKSNTQSTETTKKSKKRKASDGIALLDVIEAQLNSHSGHVRSNKRPEATKTQPNGSNHVKQEVLRVTRDSGLNGSELRVVHKTKKKKLSSTKKRVLMERLTRYIRGDKKADSSSSGGSSRVMWIRNLLSADMCEDEVAEVLRDAGELLTHCGGVEGMDVEPADGNSPPELRVRFLTTADAATAAASLDGLVLGGDPIHTGLLGVDPSPSSASNADSSEKKIGPEKSDGSDGGMHIVTLLGVVQEDDLSDPDEARETLLDFRTLCEPNGRPVSVCVKPHQEQPEYTMTEILRKRGTVDVPPFEFPLAVVQCSGIPAAVVNGELQGKVVGGRRLELRFCDCDAHDQGVYLPEHSVSVSAFASLGLRVVLRQQLDSPADIVSYLQRRATVASAHSDASMTSSAGLLRAAAALNSCQVIATPQECSKGTEVLLLGIGLQECIALQDCVTVSDPDSKMDMDPVVNIIAPYQRNTGTESSTGFITVYRRSSGCVLLVGGYLSVEDLVDAESFPDEIVSLKKDLLALLGLSDEFNEIYCRGLSFVSETSVGLERWYCNPVIELGFVSAAIAREVMLAFDGSIIGGERVRALWSRRPITSPALLSVSSDVHPSENEGNSIRKLPIHTSPARELPYATDEINTAVRDMLQILSSLQKRVKERDPINAKKKERFVMGMRQVANTVKSGRSKLILLAPDTEMSNTIDNKIHSIVDEAQSKDIPVMYTLKRRQLGKAAGSSMKQAVISICSSEGAHAQFNRIMRFVNIK